MRSLLFILLFFACINLTAQPTHPVKLAVPQSVKQVAENFRALLERPHVPAAASLSITVTDSNITETGYIFSEASEKVPLLIRKPPLTMGRKFPVVICLHGTGGSKDDGNIREIMDACVRAGFMAVAIDARFHGDRISGKADKSRQYVEAIEKAWQQKDEPSSAHPFFYDTVYDLWRLTDYLITRPDVIADRIGMTGISMGGIETWMAASVDQRIKVAVPVIAAQSFNWSLKNHLWQGRAHTIWAAHERAARDLGDTSVNAKNVAALWAKLVPGITDQFDCPSMIRLFAPRPLLLLSNEKDMNCPLGGAEIAFDSARRAYAAVNALGKFKIHVSPGEPHRFLPQHLEFLVAWFKEWL